jgi:hypothetical protein
MRRPSAPRMLRTTCRLLGVPSLDEAGAVALPLGHLGQLGAQQVGSARSSKKTCMNSSLLR